MRSIRPHKIWKGEDKLRADVIIAMQERKNSFPHLRNRTDLWTLHDTHKIFIHCKARAHLLCPDAESNNYNLSPSHLTVPKLPFYKLQTTCINRHIFDSHSCHFLFSFYSFLNVRICSLSQFYITEIFTSLCFWLLVGQNNTNEDVIFFKIGIFVDCWTYR